MVRFIHAYYPDPRSSRPPSNSPPPRDPTPECLALQLHADRIHFAPGLISEMMRWTNRPTFQRVVSFGATP